MLNQTNITFESNGRRGMHAVITIKRDGSKIGTINYQYYSWKVCDYYGQPLRGFETLDKAKEVAPTLDYPDAQLLYEQICKDVECSRRKHAEQKKEHIAALNAAARELIAGSSSADKRIGEIFAAIEHYAKDRNGADRWKETYGAYRYSQDSIYYPPGPPEPDQASLTQAAE